VRSALRYLFVVAGATCSILLFLLASASDNSGFFDRYYGWLLGLNASVAVALVVNAALFASVHHWFRTGYRLKS